jgi:hypothetical protein
VADRPRANSFFSTDKGWRGALALCVGLAAAALTFVVGLGFIWGAILFVVVTVIGWSIESQMDRRSYRASPGPTGVPWRCDLDGRQFPNRQAALHHAEHEHPERDFAEAQTHLSVAGGLPPTS